MAASHLSPDILDAQRPNKVPNTFFTDGTYIWPGGAIYYLENYNIAPNDDFLDYFDSLGNIHTVGAISNDQIKSAIRELSSL
jgi:hypothetical protein